jgi:chloramphenicol O-acetyltransferase
MKEKWKKKWMQSIEDYEEFLMDYYEDLEVDDELESEKNKKKTYIAS